MKKIITLFLLMTICISSVAQSTDFLYPYGRWQSLPEFGKKGYVELFVLRDRNAYHNFNTSGIGSLNIMDKDGNVIYESILTYEGKEKKEGTCIYYFYGRSKQGRTSRIGVQKIVKGDNLSVKIVEATGELVNRVEVKEELGWVNSFNGANYDPTSEAASEQELLNMLRDCIRDGLNIRGFGNLQQYINAHARLDMSKPIYAKPKGEGSINIFKTENLQSAKIGVLQPSDALLVVNEYNGWCEVKNNDNTKGYVSLSAVTLFNIVEDSRTHDTGIMKETENEHDGGFDPIGFAHFLVTLDNYEQACLRANEASFPGNALGKKSFEGKRTLGDKEELSFHRASKKTTAITGVHLSLNKGSEAEVCRDIENHGYKLTRTEHKKGIEGVLMTDHYYQHPDGKHNVLYITISAGSSSATHLLIFRKD